MRKIQKNLVLSMATAAALLSFSVGATFALFTDRSETAISMGAGQIDTTASLSLLGTWSAKADVNGQLVDEYGEKYILEAQDLGSFVNGGSASVSGTTLSMERITPGDKVSFRLSLTNESTVNIQARLKITVPEEDYLLASVLDFTYGQTTKRGVAAYYSAWTNMVQGVDTSETFDFAFYMPIDADNLYQGSSAHYTFAIEAVQGNAATSGEERYYQIESQATALASGDISVVGSGTQAVTTLTTNKDLQSSAPSSTTETVSVSVPSGVTLDNGAKALTLVVSEVEEQPALAIEAGEEVNVSYNLDVAGLSSSNTTPLTVTVPYSSVAAPTKIVHTKQDGTVETILPYSDNNPTGFAYAQGYITFQTTSFSLFTVVTEPERIFFTNDLGWSDVYAYLWNDAGNNGPFPGVKMTRLEGQNELGQSTYSIPCGSYTKAIFNNGSDKTKTVDIDFESGHRYWCDSGSSPYNVGHMAFGCIYFAKPNEWSDAYVYLFGGSGSGGADWPGRQLSTVVSINEYGQNIYSVIYGNYTQVVFNNGNGTQTVDIPIQSGEQYYLTGTYTDDPEKAEAEVAHLPFARYCGTLAEAIADSADGGTIKLQKEQCVIDSTFVIDKNITIDLNGQNISYSGSSLNIFTVAEGVTLTLTDSSGKVQYGKWVGNEYVLSGTYSEGTTEFVGGVIHNGKGYPDLHPSIYDERNGGAIINRGTLIIDGANIAGNSVGGNAAGISNLGGTVTLKNGQISDNKASDGSGAAIYNDGGTFNMEGGTISGNDATRGAIIVRGATFNMSGGTISHNTAKRYMIDVTPGLNNSYGVVNLEGGSISNNVTTENIGSAFFVRAGCTFNMTGGTISGNTSAHWIAKNDPYDLVYGGGAVVLYETCNASLHGGRIENNIGGGVYCGDQGSHINLGGDIYIYDNYFDSDKTIRLDVFMDVWRGKAPVLDLAFGEDAKVGLYEGHFLNDPDTYGCLLKVGIDFTNVQTEILSHLVSDRGATLIYQADCYSNVHYWNHEAYIRQIAG